jgi:hypothetical protein
MIVNLLLLHALEIIVLFDLFIPYTSNRHFKADL